MVLYKFRIIIIIIIISRRRIAMHELGGLKKKADVTDKSPNERSWAM